jgi:hypothetical protein
MRTCAQHGVPPLPYLTDVLAELPTAPTAAELDALFPDRWAATRAARASSDVATRTHDATTH